MVRIQSLFALSFSAVEFAASSQAEPTWKVCKEDTDYKPDGSDASWNDKNCHQMIAGMFPAGFTPSEETCTELGIDPQDASKIFIVGKVLGSFAAPCCGGADKDACAEHGPFNFQETWKVCEEDTTYNPTSSHPSWSGLTCEDMLLATIGAKFPSGFTASKEFCDEEGLDPQDPKKNFIVGKVLGNFAATCCGGFGKDACAKHGPYSFQATWKVCEEGDTYNPTGSHSSWSGLTCDNMLEATIGATFPSGFTASKQTCAQEGTDPLDSKKNFIVGQALGAFAETCCGGINRDSCVEYSKDLFCQKPDDFAADELVKHNNKDALCRDVAFEIGLSVAPSEKLCAEKIDANGVEGVRSKFMEDYKAKCCGGKDSMCTKFHTSPSESDGNNNSTTDTDQTSGAFHVATLTVPAAMTLFMSI